MPRWGGWVDFKTDSHSVTAWLEHEDLLVSPTVAVLFEDLSRQVVIAQINHARKLSEKLQPVARMVELDGFWLTLVVFG
ncbi:hypothetical protein REPUB_Repub10bG0023700 [Reevesia pubescens]